MSELTDLIGAIAAIAKDPDAWAKRLADIKTAGEKLAETRMAQRQAEQAAKQAAQDLETARYERGQADHANRAAGQQAASNGVRERELKEHETALTARETTLKQNEQAFRADCDRREAELAQRERAAAAKLNEASELMAAYDEAKHKAALKLAS
jgi:hypothetical protein